MSSDFFKHCFQAIKALSDEEFVFWSVRWTTYIIQGNTHDNMKIVSGVTSQWKPFRKHTILLLNTSILTKKKHSCASHLV